LIVLITKAPLGSDKFPPKVPRSRAFLGVQGGKALIVLKRPVLLQTHPGAWRSSEAHD